MKTTHQIKSDTQYYAEGPQQSRPPDGVLAAGTSVRVIMSQGSYSQVEAADGRKGFVSTSSLLPVP